MIDRDNITLAIICEVLYAFDDNLYLNLTHSIGQSIFHDIGQTLL